MESAVFLIVMGTLWANLFFFEYRYKRPSKGLNDITEAYGKLAHIKKYGHYERTIRGQ